MSQDMQIQATSHLSISQTANEKGIVAKMVQGKLPQFLVAFTVNNNKTGKSSHYPLVNGLHVSHVVHVTHVTHVTCNKCNL